MKIKIYNFTTLIIALLSVLGSNTIFRACPPMENGMWMHCHTAQLIVTFAFLGIALVSLINVFVNNAVIGSILRIINIIIAIIALLTPGIIIKMCMMSTMRCHALLKPFTIIMCILLIISEIALMIINIKSTKKD